MKNELSKIDIRCNRCNQKLMEYKLQDNNDNVVLSCGISISCHRCKRVAVLKKYTQGMIKERLVGNSFRI